MATYAVNVCDLSTLQQRDFIASLLFSVEILTSDVVDAEGNRMDGSAIILSCENTRIEAIIQIIRKKYSKNIMRIYRSETGKGGWKRV